MTTNETTSKQPLWLLIEEKILGLSAGDLDAGKLEQTIAQLANALDDTGHNVSKNGGNLIELRRALAARIKAGNALMEDFNAAISALKLEDVTSASKATAVLTDGLKGKWPVLAEYDNRMDVLKIVKDTRLDLYVTEAKSQGGEAGIRYLIADAVAPEIIIDRLGISEDEFKKVDAAVKAELAEIERVKGLFAEVEGKSIEDKVKRMFKEKVADELMIEIGGLSQAEIDGVKKALEAEAAEKARLAAEAEAKKKAELEGPPLDQIADDQIVEYIDAIRDIMDFSDKPEEIRTMAEQSKIPKAIIDVAVAGADELDKLQAKAEG
jgi:hypothetical protein